MSTIRGPCLEKGAAVFITLYYGRVLLFMPSTVLFYSNCNNMVTSEMLQDIALDILRGYRTFSMQVRGRHPSRFGCGPGSKAQQPI